MTVAQKLTSNMAYAVGGRLIGAVFGLTTTAIMARHLGPDIFGAFRTAFAWSVLCCMFANLGLDIVCLREISRPDSDRRKIIGTALTLRLLVGALCVLIAMAIPWIIPVKGEVSTAQLSLATAIAALGSLISLGNDLVATIFQQSLTQKRASIAELTGGAATLALTGLAVLWDGGLLAFVGATSGGLVVAALTAVLLAEHIVPVRPQLDLKLGRSLIISGLPVFGAEMLGALAARLDTVLLSVLSVASEVGFYGVGNRIKEIAVRLPWLFAALLMPILTRLATEPKEFRRVLADALVVAWIFATAVMVGLGCFADIAVQLLAGGDFTAATTTVQLTGPTLAAGSISAVLQFAAYALDRGTATLKVKAVSSIAGLAGMWLLIPKGGADGAALGVMIGEIVFMLGLVRFASPDGHAFMPWGRLALVAGVGGVCSGVAFGLRALGLPWYVGVVALMAIYPALLLASRAVTIAQLRTLTGKSPPATA